MTAIYYENSEGEVYHIDEVSQRILVYVYLHGAATSEELVEPVGVEEKEEIRARIRNQLGRTTTGLVEVRHSTQMKFGNNPDDPIQEIRLNDIGDSFVEKHRADLSKPVDLARLAKRVAGLQIENGIYEILRDRIKELEDRVEELESQE